MTGDGQSPSWAVVARWVVGIAGTLLMAFSGFLAHQVFVIIPDIATRQSNELIEQRGQLKAIQEVTLDSLRYEIRQLGMSIDKLSDRLREQEMRDRERR